MNVKISTGIRLGRISYINTLPFYHGFESEQLEARAAFGEPRFGREGVPSQINAWISAKEIDIAPISALEYARNPKDYYLLPGLCIGAHEFSGSVLLISKEKIENLDGKKIAITQDSLSAQALAKILLKKRFGFRNEFTISAQSADDMLKEASACLVIGDAALFYEPKEFVYKYDLSELWWEWALKPFCFSVWAVRREFFDANSEEVIAFSKRLKANTVKNLGQLQMLIQEGLGLQIHDAKFPVVFSYLSSLKFNFNETMQQGLARFFDDAAELGFVPHSPALQMIEGE